MRTTLTLDDDVAALLRREMSRTKQPLKQLVNTALRRGLASQPSRRRKGRPYRTPSVSLGRCLIGQLDDVGEALALGEGDTFR